MTIPHAGDCGMTLFWAQEKAEGVQGWGEGSRKREQGYASLPPPNFISLYASSSLSRNINKLSQCQSCSLSYCDQWRSSSDAILIGVFFTLHYCSKMWVQKDLFFLNKDIN